jgi:hypothetical protein
VIRCASQNVPSPDYRVVGLAFCIALPRIHESLVVKQRQIPVPREKIIRKMDARCDVSGGNPHKIVNESIVRRCPKYGSEKALNLIQRRRAESWQFHGATERFIATGCSKSERDGT